MQPDILRVARGRGKRRECPFGGNYWSAVVQRTPYVRTQRVTGQHEQHAPSIYGHGYNRADDNSLPALIVWHDLITFCRRLIGDVSQPCENKQQQLYTNV